MNTETLEAVWQDKYDFNDLIIAKYLSYYFLSSLGKKQLEQHLESKENYSFKALNISSLKQLQIPIALRMAYVVKNIEAQIHWHDAERYSNQLDDSSTMFDTFETIIKSLANNNPATHYVSENLFTIREFGVLLAQYIVNTPLYKDLNVSVVLESMVDYKLFKCHQQHEWDDTSIDFYSPHDEIAGDIIIVIKQFEQPLHLPANAKVIYLKER